MTRTKVLLDVMRIGTLVIAPAFVATLVVLWTGWTQAILGWALTNLAEQLLPGYAEWNAQ